MVLYKYVYIYIYLYSYNFHIFINIDDSRSSQVVIGGHIYNHNHTSQKIATVSLAEGTLLLDKTILWNERDHHSFDIIVLFLCQQRRLFVLSQE